MKLWKRQNYKNTNQISDWQRLGMGKRVKRKEGIWESKKIVLYLDCSVGFMAVCIYQNLLKRTNFLYVNYVNKNVKNIMIKMYFEKN